ncbi:MAG: gliding motility protein GldN [Marinilabiliaceae bacterium]|nr:gliding motility protein GldN [Marinilabiliaceae bacterium]
MKRVFLILMIVGLFNSVEQVSAQNVLDGIYEKEHVTNNRPIPYPYIREADVLWAKKVWRIIDLRERINLPLYYPVRPMDDRYSLIDLLIHGIQYEGLTAYSTKHEDEFRVPLTLDQVNAEMGALADTQEIQNVETGLFETKIISGEKRTDEVKQIMVKEIWFFDRNYSKLDVRILGLCPIREFVDNAGGDDEIKRKMVFWVYFNQARDIFARHEVFNPRNDAQRRTFDDIFIKRHFGSYIVREANVYNNRQIDQYAVGMDAMLESERIKNDIATFEHDLWEF